MTESTRTSGKAIASFLAGLVAAACGLLTLVTRSDLFLLGVLLASILAVTCGFWARADVRRAGGLLRGKALAGWGIGIPVGGLTVGLLLLPAT